MAELMEPVKGFPIGKFILVGIGKQIVQNVARPMIGDATYKSGAIKIGVAYGLGNVLPVSVRNNIFGEALLGGMVVDGTEDVAISLIRSASDMFPSLAKLTGASSESTNMATADVYF